MLFLEFQKKFFFFSGPAFTLLVVGSLAEYFFCVFPYELFY